MSNQVYSNFSTRKKYNVNTTHIQTSSDETTTTILNELVLDVVDDAETIDEILVIDPFGIIGKRNASTLPSGDISGPNSATINAIPTWDDVSGTTLKDNPKTAINSGGGIKTNNSLYITNDSIGSSIIFNIDENFNCTEENYCIIRANNNGGVECITNDLAIPQTIGSPPNSFVGLWTFSSNDCLIKKPLRLQSPPINTEGNLLCVFGVGKTVQQFDMKTIPLNNTETHLLVKNNITGNIGYRDANTLGDVVGPISSVDNTIPRYDGTTGKLLQNSGVIIDDSDNMVIPGSLEIQSVQTQPQEINLNFVAGFTTGSGIIKKQAKEDLFQQNLTPSSSVEFESITADLVLRTNLILEKSLGSGVEIQNWFFEPQNIRSEGAINQNDPLRIDLKHLGDNDSILSINGYQHDNNGIMFDMDKESTGSADDMISGSINANVFINKELGALKFLITNGITKSTTFLKSTMNNVMEIGKTYVNINEPCTFSEAVLITTTSTSTTNYDNIVIDSTSGELKKQEQAYTSLYINILQTLTINTLNVYEQITNYSAGGISKNLNPDLLAGDFESLINGRLRITISGSFQGNASPTKAYELSLFKNGSPVIQTQTIFSTSTSLDEYYSAYSETVDDCLIGDVYDVRIRNTTDTTNISIRTFYFAVQSIII